MAAEMISTVTTGLIIFFLAGIFGWTAAYGVISRALQFEFDRKVRGKTKVYVDDTMECCAARDLDYNAVAVKLEVEDLLGEGASADDKF